MEWTHQSLTGQEKILPTISAGTKPGMRTRKINNIKEIVFKVGVTFISYFIITLPAIKKMI